MRFAHEVHPSEIAYDYWTTKRALEAVDHRPAFGLNFDPSHFVWQDLDPVGFLYDFRDRIYHVDCKEARSASTAATAASARICRGATPGAAGTSSPPATATSPGRTSSGCSGPSATKARSRSNGRTQRMDRLTGAPEALASLKRFDFDPPSASFDASLRRRRVARTFQPRGRVAPHHPLPPGLPLPCLETSLSCRKQKFDLAVAQGLSVEDEQVYRPFRVHEMTRVTGVSPCLR